MSILNTNHSYGSISKLFHWVIALLVFIMLALGYTFLFMDSGQNKLAVITLHKSIGLVVLFFVSLRLIWRLLNVQPLRSELSPLEKVLVNFVQWFFYLALFVMPVIFSSVPTSLPLPNTHTSNYQVHERSRVTSLVE